MDLYQLFFMVFMWTFTFGDANPVVSVPLRNNHKSKKNFMSDLLVRVVMTGRGTLEAEVSWKQSLISTEVQYEITWWRHSCNVDSRMPHCDLKERKMPLATISARPGEDMRILLVGLTFNSEYRVSVLMKNDDVMKFSQFYTDLCLEVDNTFMRCGRLEDKSSHGSSDTLRLSTLDEERNKLLYGIEGEDNSALSTRTRFMLVLAVSCGVGTIFIMVAMFYMYRRCVQLSQQSSPGSESGDLPSRPPSYSELPLLNLPYQDRRLSDISHLQMDRPLAQTIMSGSPRFAASHV